MSAPLSSLDLISAFEAVMATGSLSGAARRLGRSQPTIRRQVAALEQELDAALFTRSENGLRPTDMARDLMPKAQSVLSEAGALVRAASGTGGVTGRVRITCSRVFAAWVVPEIVAGLLDRHPGLSVEIAARDGIENLVRGAADVAIRLTPPDQDAVVCRKVVPRAVGLFAADLAALGPARRGHHRRPSGRDALRLGGSGRCPGRRGRRLEPAAARMDPRAHRRSVGADRACAGGCGRGHLPDRHRAAARLAAARAGLEPAASGVDCHARGSSEGAPRPRRL